MARNENPPFERGSTFFGAGGTPNVTDGFQYEGKEYLFEDINPLTRAVRTNRYVRCRIVRNSSGIALLPRRLVRFEVDGLDYGARVDGYTRTTAARGYPVDEYLPAAGVANNDLFYIVVNGPAMCVSDLAAVDTISVGDRLVALTAVTSQATTAGRVDLAAFAVTEQALADQVAYYIGHALSALTSANTNSDILVEVGHW